MVAASRPASFSGIGFYITSTHVALVASAVLVPAVVYGTNSDWQNTESSIAATIVVGILGALALLTEAYPEHRLSRPWRRVPVMAVWSVFLVISMILLLLLAPADVSTFAPTVLPLALTFRAIAAGSFWFGSLRVVGATILCVLVTGIMRGAEVTEAAGTDLTIAAGAVLAFAVLGQDTVYALAVEVDDLRTTEAEHAVRQERQRFAGDLHDIQGQHLQLLAVEAHLVERLIDSGRTDDARDHAGKIAAIAATAVEEMRGVVHGYRTVTVKEEMANAVRVLEAAGITVDAHVVIPPGISDDNDRLLGLTIREGITNLLRHTRSQSCRLIVASEQREGCAGVGLELSDSGPRVSSEHTVGNGISELTRRYHQAGGVLRLSTTAAGGSALGSWLPMMDEREVSSG